MTVVSREIVVAASCEEAFEFVANFESCAIWDPGVVHAERRPWTRAGVGATYDVRVDFNGRQLPMIYEVVVWQPGARVVLNGAGSTVRAVDDISFEAANGGTRIRYRADLRMRGPLAPITPLLRRKFEALGDAAMAGMARAFRER
jgi:carbon monoxide dehydrogenase subunit G